MRVSNHKEGAGFNGNVHTGDAFFAQREKSRFVKIIGEFSVKNLKQMLKNFRSFNQQHLLGSRNVRAQR